MHHLLAISSIVLLASTSLAEDAKPKRLLLIGQSPDNHAWSLHEYMAGQRILASMLQKVPGVQTVVVNGDEPWREGPGLLDGADGVVLFASEGAKWVSAKPERLAAFQRLAKRKGGLAVLHWGMGTREAEPIEPFVALFGGCHGGPDRRYKFLTTTLTPVAKDHPATCGLAPIELEEEFYYALKTPENAKIVPLMRAGIDGEEHMVAWAWERPDGGRSFGFSGLHFHRNWGEETYRRFVVQSVLWAIDVPVPEEMSLEIDDRLLAMPRPRPESE